MIQVETTESTEPLSVGVIHIVAASRPHKVARSIEKLNQNDVYVRHGSVVVKASPDEIIRMDDESRGAKVFRRYREAGETHLELGNYRDATKSFSRAIEITPTAELFLARGKAFEHLMNATDWSNLLEKELLADSAFKDYSDAIALTSSTELELEARLGRFRVRYIREGDWEIWDQDFEWLKANAEGRTLGEVFYWHNQIPDFFIGVDSYEDETLPELDEAIRLGYDEPKVYRLRADVKFYFHNYGLALEDIDKAIGDITHDDAELNECLSLKIAILAKMNDFDAAYDTILQAHRSLGRKFRAYHSYEYTLGAYELVYRYCINLAVTGPESAEQVIKTARPIFQDLAISGTFESDYMQARFSKIMDLIRMIIGEEFLQENRHLLS
jgi:tetratricopeptide (TPR) repeat protein